MVTWSENSIEELAALRKDYLAKLPDKIVELETRWQEFLKKPNESEKQELLRLLHTLAGSAPSFGLIEVGELAKKLEDFLKFMISPDLVSTDNWPQINNKIENLKKVILIDDRTRNDHISHLKTVRDDASLPSPSKSILLIDDDPDFTQELSSQIKRFGYDSEIVSDFDKSKNFTSDSSPPAAVILNRDSFPNEMIGDGIALPIIFLSAQDDLASRLSAVRAGGRFYLTKPVNVEELRDILDGLIFSRQSDPYRILIVEDEPQLAASYGAILKQAGMITETVSNPFEVMQHLISFKPELILLDLYMPGCDGMELAKVIRQQSAYVSLPIVFLSSETDVAKQLAALGLGGDDFLTKPIAAEHLIVSVSIRAERLRTLRSFMTQDALTGLANHTTLLSRLDDEIARARRNGNALTFAMIDIDHFKKVNDTYGHPTGDRVIKNLARLLKQRLRQTDIVGRYGGEEFAIVLPDTNKENALKILDELLVQFSGMKHLTTDGDFSVSMSCGLAAFPAYRNQSKIIEAADRALYCAKHSGRNRAILAE